MATIARQTKLFLGVSLLVMSGFAIAIANTCEENKKGGKYGMVVMGLVLSIISALFNFWKFAQESGMAAYASQQASGLYAKTMGKVGAGTGGATNIGTTAVA